MNRFVMLLLAVLTIGVISPAFSLDGAQFTKVLTAAVQADEYLYSLMGPETPKHSPEFQAALAGQKKTRAAVANEINALDSTDDIQQALVIARAFSAKGGSFAAIGSLAENLLRARLPFVTAHQLP
ncbi:MAG TPA: hypothetical protein PLU72_14175 [Candidatus Ozemobacteraceae bacterium]|nr:hypothetical protein [Candidatus Ozemobacteraceae bacterium]